MTPVLHRFTVRLLAAVVAVGLATVFSPPPAEAVGFVVNRADLQAWLKAHPSVKVHTVRVTTIEEWLKTHPNVDPRNRPTFKPDEVVTMPVPLTPSLWPKYPSNAKSCSVLLIALDPKEGIVWEANGITAKEIKVPSGKLKPGRKYFWQTGFILNDGTIQDGGTFQFETEK